MGGEAGLLALAACGGMGRAGMAGPRGEKGCCWAAVKRRATLEPGQVVLGRVQRGRGERCCEVSARCKRSEAGRWGRPVSWLERRARRRQREKGGARLKECADAGELGRWGKRARRPGRGRERRRRAGPPGWMWAAWEKGLGLSERSGPRDWVALGIAGLTGFSFSFYFFSFLNLILIQTQGK